MDTDKDSKDENAGSDLLCESKKNKKSKKSKKRKHSSSNSGSESEPSKGSKSKHKKKCKKKHKHGKEKKHKMDRTSQLEKSNLSEEEQGLVGPEIPKEFLQNAHSMAPMSKEEWEKKQSTVRKVFDETTGRTRLIRGEGEVIEEIVSRDRHQAINRQATKGDGNFFQSNMKKYI